MMAYTLCLGAGAASAIKVTAGAPRDAETLAASLAAGVVARCQVHAGESVLVHEAKLLDQQGDLFRALARGM